MKKFELADIVVLNLADTAFGPEDPNHVDDVKHPVVENNVVVGYEEEYGQAHSSNRA